MCLLASFQFLCKSIYFLGNNKILSIKNLLLWYFYIDKEGET